MLTTSLRRFGALRRGQVRAVAYDAVVTTVVHGDFEWDDEKAESNRAKHGVAFEEAAVAMKDLLSLDFDDLVEPENLITLPASRAGVSFTSFRLFGLTSSASSARVTRHQTNDDDMKKQTDPSNQSLEEMPEIDDERFRRRPGRGHHVHRDAGGIIAIDADLWSHFGSAEAVNDALRQVVAGKKAAGT
jgi:hypothetical protein